MDVTQGGFGDGFDNYQAEAEQRRGQTPQRPESQRRVQSYGAAEWVQSSAAMPRNTPTARSISAVASVAWATIRSTPTSAGSIGR